MSTHVEAEENRVDKGQGDAAATEAARQRAEAAKHQQAFEGTLQAEEAARIQEASRSQGAAQAAMGTPEADSEQKRPQLRMMMQGPQNSLSSFYSAGQDALNGLGDAARDFATDVKGTAREGLRDLAQGVDSFLGGGSEAGIIHREVDDRGDTPVDQQREKAVHYQDYKQFEDKTNPGTWNAGKSNITAQEGFYQKVDNSPDPVSRAGRSLADAGNSALNRLGIELDQEDKSTGYKPNTAGIAEAPREKLGRVGGQEVQTKWDSTGLFNIQDDVFHSQETTLGVRNEQHNQVGDHFEHAQVTRVGAYHDHMFMGGADGFDPLKGDLTGRASYMTQGHLGVGAVREGSYNDDLDHVKAGADYRLQGGLEFMAASRGSAYAGPLGAAAGIEGQLGADVLSAQGSAKAGTDLDAFRLGEVDFNPSVGVGGKAYVGAEARGQAAVSFTPTNMGAKVGGEAFAGAKAAVYGEVGAGDLGKLGGGVEGYAGAGIKGEAKLELEDGKFKFALSGGAALGLGLGAEVKAEVDFSAAADLATGAVKEAAGSVATLASGALDLADRALDKAPEYLRRAEDAVGDKVDNFVADSRELAARTRDLVENKVDNFVDGAQGLLETAQDVVADEFNHRLNQTQGLASKAWEVFDAKAGPAIEAARDKAGEIVSDLNADNAQDALEFLGRWAGDRLDFSGSPKTSGDPATDSTAGIPPDQRPELNGILADYQNPAEDELVDWKPDGLLGAAYDVAGGIDNLFQGKNPLEGGEAKPVRSREAEMLDDMSAVEQLRMNHFKDTARNTAIDEYNFSPDDAPPEAANQHHWVEVGGHQDAYRHAYFSAMMTREFGADYAKEFTDAHEAGVNPRAQEEAMDLFNNELGIKIAQENPDASEAELAALVKQAIDNGRAVVVDRGGDLAWSDQVEPGRHGALIQ
ncbi:MAG: hypothetical protein ACFCBW_14810 [Candidatus Competibacterales bacterium]